MNVTIDGFTFTISTEADAVRLCFALQTLDALSGRAA
jgi:hypothetical protein